MILASGSKKWINKEFFTRGGEQSPLRWFPLAIVCVLSLSMLSGCGQDGRDRQLNSYIKAVKERSPEPIEPVPKMKPLPKYAYPSVKRRNPFKPYVAEKETSKIAGPDLDRQKQPLEAFPMDSLRMVGILREGQKIWGIISAPDGVAYRVTIGNYMGKNFGRIIAVKNKEIKLVETVRIAGRWEKRPVTVRLQTDE